MRQIGRNFSQNTQGYKKTPKAFDHFILNIAQKIMKLKSLNPTVILIVIIVIAVILRVFAVIWFGNQVVDLPGTNDQISYHSLAIRVVEGHGFSFGQDWWPVTAANSPTAHWSFLYTFYLALIYRLFGQNPIVGRLIQAVLVGILQPLLAFWIGRRLFGVAVGLVAAGISAIYIYFIYYSATLMTEPFYIIPSWPCYCWL